MKRVSRIYLIIKKKIEKHIHCAVNMAPATESTFNCFSSLVARKLVQNFVFFSFQVSLIFTCVYNYPQAKWTLVNIYLDFVSFSNIHQYSLHLRRIIVNYCLLLLKVYEKRQRGEQVEDESEEELCRHRVDVTNFLKKVRLYTYTLWSSNQLTYYHHHHHLI
jgi:hypothetical protein